jgi:hypothetical protein
VGSRKGGIRAELYSRGRRFIYPDVRFSAELAESNLAVFISFTKLLKEHGIYSIAASFGGQILVYDADDF